MLNTRFARPGVLASTPEDLLAEERGPKPDSAKYEIYFSYDAKKIVINFRTSASHVSADSSLLNVGFAAQVPEIDWSSDLGGTGLSDDQT